MKMKLGRCSHERKANFGETKSEPIIFKPTAREANILRLLKEMANPDQIDPLEPQGEIVAMGLAALPALFRLKKIIDEKTTALEIEEIIDRIQIESFKDSEKDPSSVVRGIVGIVCDLTREPFEIQRFLDILNEMGTRAVPELLVIASGQNKIEADCALSILGDVAKANPGEKILLEVIPLLEATFISVANLAQDGQNVLKLGENNVSRGDYENIYPGFNKVEISLNLLTTLNQQFPGNERVNDAIALILGKTHTNDPVLNSILNETIKKVGGFDPLNNKGNKTND